MLLQAGVLGSQPSVPVIAFTGDAGACAFPRRIASQQMVIAWKRQLPDALIERPQRLEPGQEPPLHLLSSVKLGLALRRR
jgi:hypothetical protein